MNTLENKTIKIENIIYEIRGLQVMLDSDVALLFGYETKQVNRQVQRNLNRFPKNYYFQLNDVEYKNLKCQNGTSSFKKYGGRRYLPYVFTEHGITMLAGILKSDIAVEMSLKIVNTFIAMRRYLANGNYQQRLNNIETKIIEHDNKLEEVFSKMEKEKNNHIFFEGKIYDAYSLLVDILSLASTEIIIIDNYIDKKILDVLSKIKLPILFITNHISNLDLEKYQKQYKK